jgi:hypothetical protein
MKPAITSGNMSRRLAWFVAIWLASVLALSAVAFAIRAVLL